MRVQRTNPSPASANRTASPCAARPSHGRRAAAQAGEHDRVGVMVWHDASGAHPLVEGEGVDGVRRRLGVGVHAEEGVPHVGIAYRRGVEHPACVGEGGGRHAGDEAGGEGRVRGYAEDDGAGVDGEEGAEGGRRGGGGGGDNAGVAVDEDSGGGRGPYWHFDIWAGQVGLLDWVGLCNDF